MLSEFRKSTCLSREEDDEFQDSYCIFEQSANTKGQFLEGAGGGSGDSHCASCK